MHKACFLTLRGIGNVGAGDLVAVASSFSVLRLRCVVSESVLISFDILTGAMAATSA